MNRSRAKKRCEIPASSQWAVDRMYSRDADWQADIDRALAESEAFSRLAGTLMEAPGSLLQALKAYFSMLRRAEHAYVYARMRHDEDNTNPAYTEKNSQALSALARVSAASAFLRPEILDADPETLQSFLSREPGLRIYRHFLESILENRPHVLPPGEEQLLATLGECLNAPDEIFTMLNDADLDFGEVRDDEGKPVVLTHGNYTLLMESKDREVRRQVYETLYARYAGLNHTLAAAYHYSVKNDVILARLRHYDSALAAALSGDRIPLAVYEQLIAAVHDFLPELHRYMRLRQRALGLDALHMYDIYQPLARPDGLTCTYAEAVDIACRALAPLGEDYVSTLRRGLTEERWVDIYENEGKTSGAYSFGAYDSAPYILMNFTGQLRDVFTLVHEGGHSMHAYYTRQTQPYVYGSHSIFTAEVASTVNETLLIHHLLQEAKSEEMRRYLLNLYLDEFRATLFRQAQFAEFERNMHRIVEDGGSLTAEGLNRAYDALNTSYYGPAVEHDDLIRYEWSRIPHFYRAYYVYQYATGYSAANAIANRILGGGRAERDDYLRFLTTGDSDYPVELLRIAGVDMASDAPVRSALETFRSRLDQLEKLL